ncbi:MAG TPA: amino acid ABC transporter ATP-binding protein [Gemmataceae bacterium]|nr:amino acid ABC transporter ATP-binding protein [Gemmataceae bacterium]
MISARNLVKDYGTGRVLNGVSLSVEKGEVAVVIGPSGCGKSTLLRCLNGLEMFQEGEVQVDELRLEGGIPDADSAVLLALRRRLGMVFQQFNLFPHMSTLDNVTAGPRFALGRPRADAEKEARALLARVGLADFTAARPEQLSGGQQQRVAIARALAMHPAAILFDEPTSALDPRMANEVLRVMADLARSGQTMVVVTHAMGFARRVAQTVHVMFAGQVIECGPPAQVFDRAGDERVRAFLAEAEGA